MLDQLYNKSLQVEALSDSVINKLRSVSMLEGLSISQDETAALLLIRRAITQELHDNFQDLKPI